MNHRSTRTARIVAVAVAGAVAGLAATIAVADDGSDRNPGSYHPAERAAIAEWGAEHRLSGLSPESLTPTGWSEYGWSPRFADEMKAIADYAREHQLSGLSPASLQPVGTQP
jgi:hypothetical protein